MLLFVFQQNGSKSANNAEKIQKRSQIFRNFLKYYDRKFILKIEKFVFHASLQTFATYTRLIIQLQTAQTRLVSHFMVQMQQFALGIIYSNGRDL
jgi:hypothetical protein